ncbi:hypothetical protein AB1284_25080 [Bacillus sp. S2(2024)]|uniref:hypothetical protein n=1 Tax=Bacillus sp. S2(2024) TaxID=3162887 RepID=UPI003D25EC12
MKKFTWRLFIAIGASLLPFLPIIINAPDWLSYVILFSPYIGIYFSIRSLAKEGHSWVIVPCLFISIFLAIYRFIPTLFIIIMFLDSLMGNQSPMH